MGDVERDYEVVKVEGRASASGDEAYIDGKIVLVHPNGKSETERVLFRNSLWVRQITEASDVAQEILENARSHR
jgi:hypothetical protein